MTIFVPRRREDFFNENGTPTLRFTRWMESATESGNENSTQVATNTTQISTNTGDITTNTGDIVTLLAGVTNNTAEIATIDTRVKVVEGVTPSALIGSTFVSDGAGGGSFIRIQGFGQFQDTDTTVGTPSQNIATGTRTLWSNDGGTLSLQKSPSDLANPLWNVSTNLIQAIALYDVYSVSITFKCQNYAGAAPNIKCELDTGSTIIAETTSLLNAGSEQSIIFNFTVAANAAFIANDGKIYITYTGTGTCDIFGSDILIVRDSKNYV